MFKEKWASIKQELQSFSAPEMRFILAAMFCGFCISAEYAIIRPVSHSVFIHYYGAKLYPIAWLAVVPLNFLLVSLYNRFLPRLGCFKMLLTLLTAGVVWNTVAGFYLKSMPGLPFLYFMWKEVYILLMFQQIWSVIQYTMKPGRAKYLYGLIFAVGGAGGALGSLIPGFLAVKMGSENLLFMSIPLSCLFALLYFILIKNSERLGAEIKFDVPSQESSLLHGFKLIKGSRLLTFILMIVVLMQFSSTLIDFQFSTLLEKTIPDKDLRTEYAGRLFSIINIITISLQCLGTFLLVHFFRLKGSHFFVPMALFFNALGFALFPFFGMISCTFVTVKSFDFSLFNVIKEMLYLPLKLDEKFRAKAVIDVFAYRTAKAFGAFIILFFQFFNASHIIPLLSWGTITILALWIALVFLSLRDEKIFLPNS